MQASCPVSSKVFQRRQEQRDKLACMPPDAPVPRLVLALGATAADASALRAALRQAGVQAVVIGSYPNLVQEAADVAPQQIICYLPHGAGRWAAGLGGCPARHPAR